MKLLICSDGSEQAERALKLGATLAAGCHAEVTLLGIAEDPSNNTGILNALKRGQAIFADKKIQAELITKPGDPIVEIVKRTQETHYDLVVIGAVRKSSRGAFWMSSKSYKIIKEIKPPVLSVAGKVGPIKRVLICSGGKPYIDAAVQITGRLAKCVTASVVLLHVVPRPPAMYTGLSLMEPSLEQLLESGSELGVNLTQEKQMLESFGVQVELRLRHGPVLNQIKAEIDAGNYDLVVTGSAPSRLFQTYILGDISREIVNRVNCAVLVVRSRWTPPSPSGPGLWWWGRPEEKSTPE